MGTAAENTELNDLGKILFVGEKLNYILKEFQFVKSLKFWWSMARVCVYSNSRNDVPRVAQRYGTIAAYTRCRASVLVVFIVFCVHMHSFAGLIRRTPPPMFSDTAITDRHSDTTILLGADILVYWIGKIVRTCAPGESPSTSCVQGEHPIH